MKKIIPSLLLIVFMAGAEAQNEPLQGKVHGLGINIDSLLKEKVAGLNILQQDTSAKGIPVCLDCRPKTTGSDLRPLLVIDGQRVAWGRINSLSPDDIAFVRLLKAGECIAEYMHDGMNGAVIVATKQYLERMLLGKAGCLVVRDTVPGKITRPVKAMPLVVSEERLIVVDGVPVLNNEDRLIPEPGNIERVDILKAEELVKNSNIFPCGRTRDVVLITTKPIPVRTLVVSRRNGQPLPNATVSIRFRGKEKNDKMIIAGSAGHFTIEDRLSRIETIKVTSSGYRERLLLPNELRQANGMIGMEPAVQTGDTAFVVCNPSRHRVSCGYTITIIKRNKGGRFPTIPGVGCCDAGVGNLHRETVSAL